MNLNLKSRLGVCVGNGTFRAGSSWPYGSPGSYLGDISPTEIVKRASEGLRLSARDFPGYGKAEKSHEGETNWYHSRAASYRPYSIADVYANSLSTGGLQVIVHNTALWRDWVRRWFAIAIDMSSGAAWTPDGVAKIRKGLRASQNAFIGEAESIIALANEYIANLGSQKVSDTGTVTTAPVVLPLDVPAQFTPRKVIQMPDVAVMPSGESRGAAKGMPGWLLPIGAGAAAFFMLKG